MRVETEKETIYINTTAKRRRTKEILEGKVFCFIKEKKWKMKMGKRNTYAYPKIFKSGWGRGFLE